MAIIDKFIALRQSRRADAESQQRIAHGKVINPLLQERARQANQPQGPSASEVRLGKQQDRDFSDASRVESAKFADAFIRSDGNVPQQDALLKNEVQRLVDEGDNEAVIGLKSIFDTGDPQKINAALGAVVQQHQAFNQPTQTPTSSQKEAAFLFPDDPEKQRAHVLGQSQKSGQTINIGDKDTGRGKPEAGMQDNFDEEGNFTGRSVIKGSARDRENIAALHQNRTESVGVIIDNNQTVRSLNKAIKNAKGNTGIFGKALGFIPGTDQYDFSQEISTLMSRLAMGKMIDLKAKSPTGSTGFGALSQKELEVMQRGIASLEQSLSIDEFRKNAQIVIDSYEKNTHLLELGFIEPATDFDKRLNQIIRVGLDTEDAGIIMRSEGLFPANVPSSGLPSPAPASQPQAQTQPSSVQEGQTATNQQTGETLVFRGGAWVSQ